MEEQKKSLSEYVRETREKAGFSVQGLSKKSGLTVEQIEDIEAGKDLFLPATVRQKLAKGLKVNPCDIKEYERILLVSYDAVTDKYIKSVKRAILDGETENLRCPICSSKLTTKVVRLLDLENNIALHPKAQCSKCSFQIK
ncbi:MAG: helix-turn-helix domain-containing protein [Candidatus Gastranaerophilales bacterium]|nr:helix-turn-helix domain-containing protein [Candidatus Gastranaerophilales bacterium]